MKTKTEHMWPRNDEPGADGTAGTPPATPPTPAEPAAYQGFEAKDITLPEGVVRDDELIGKFTKYATENKISKEQAQAIVTMQAERQQQALAALKSEEQAVYAQWEKGMKAIPDHADAIDKAKKLVEKFGDQDTREIFLNGDLLQHPGTVKMLHAIAKLVGPDTMPEGMLRAAPPASQPKKTAAQSMYGGDVVVPVNTRNKEISK